MSLANGGAAIDPGKRGRSGRTHPTMRWLWALAAVLGGAVVPLMGYAYLFGAHPHIDERLPFWVVVCIPTTALGPSDPSVLVFLLAFLGNALIWGTALYWLMYGLELILRSLLWKLSYRKR